MRINSDRDALLTDFGKATLDDRYLMPGESYQGLFSRVASAYASDNAHAQRIYDYISQLWFMPATPILSNGGTKRGLPISCYLSDVDDSMPEINRKWGEAVALSSKGGGIGMYWGRIRPLGDKIGEVGTTSGIIPFIKVMDALTLAISQGSLRRGSSAMYLDIDHPEIMEFLELRKPSGDLNRRSLNVHHGVMVTDAFMRAVERGERYALINPRDGSEMGSLDAREVFQKLVEMRLSTGEPYMVFKDTVNRAIPDHHRKAGLLVRTSNLCSEITLPTAPSRTAVCCLSSVNLEKWYEWKDNELFYEDILRFLDNVLSDYIKKAPPSMEDAIFSALRERSVGLGAMGFHSLLQSRGVPFESAMAKAINLTVFRHMKTKVDEANEKLAQELGPCPDNEEWGNGKMRFSNCTAIAPTASISIIAGGTSACIEPIPANIYTHKTLSGSFTVKNKYLDQIIKKYVLGYCSDQGSAPELAYERIWESILEKEGSVQHLDFLTETQKDIYKTSFEIDQRWVIELGADRAPLIDQAQSLNLFIPADVNKWDLAMLHYTAWRKGVKSLYYLRSKSVQRAGFAGGVEKDNTISKPVLTTTTDYEECLACQ